MAKWVHRMLSIDVESMTGVCAECGPVSLKRKTNTAGGRVRYACRVAESRWKSSEWPGAWKHTKRGKLGVDPEQWSAMLEAQEGRCAICGDPFGEHHTSKGACLDHCHSTGQIRDVLCQDCNLALGYLHDSPDQARLAAAYLERHAL